MLKSCGQLVIMTVVHQAGLVHLVKLSELCDLSRHETLTCRFIHGTVMPQKEGPPAAVAAARWSNLAARRLRIRVQKDKSLQGCGG